MGIFPASLEYRNIYHINNEISHLRYHFLHSGSGTGIPCLHILENQRNLHKKSFILQNSILHQSVPFKIRFVIEICFDERRIKKPEKKIKWLCKHVFTHSTDGECHAAIRGFLRASHVALTWRATCRDKMADVAPPDLHLSKNKYGRKDKLRRKGEMDG